jgi:hypothetical protein
MRLCGPSRTRMRQPRMGIGSIRPVRRSSSCGHSADASACRQGVRRPSLDLHSSSEFLTGNPCRPAGCPAGRTTLPLLDFSCPTTQSRPAASCLGSGSLRRPGRVRGLATSCATHTADPADACASERPWASPFKDFPSLQSVPLSGPLPSYRYPRSASLDERRHTTQPASGPCSCNESVLSPESQVTPVADPFLGFFPPEHAPIRPGARFVSRRLPSRPWTA